MKYNKNRIVYFLICTISLLGIISTACTKYDTPASVLEELEDAEQDTSIVRKVLLINIDGGVGQIVKEIMPQHIASILSSSKYSFDGFCSVAEGETHAGEEEPVSWASMLTGVINVKHKIKNNTYIQSISMTPEAPDVTIDYYPTLLYRIRNNDPLAQTLCITPWRALNERFLGDAHKTITSVSDEATKDSTVFSLQNENYILTMASFKGALETGKSNGFTITNANYKMAIETIDSYIGELMDAVKSRENYEKEDWLIIITSNNGGVSDGAYGGTSDEERNTFTIFHYMNFSEQEMNGTFITSPRFTQGVTGIVPDLEQRYAFNVIDSMTVEMIFRINARDDGTYSYGNWDKLLGKKKWGLYRKGNEGTVIGVDVGGWLEEAVWGSFDDGLWHSISVSMMYDSNTARKKVKMYYDGGLMRSVDYDLNESEMQVDTSDFILGGNINFNVAEVRIWDTVLNEYEFDQNACTLNMLPTHPNYDRLIGYWNFLDQGAILNDTVLVSPIAGIPDMYLSESPGYRKSANTLACHFDAGDIVLENETIAPQIFYWLNIDPSANWKLDRPEFLSKYNLETYRPE